LIGIAGVLKSFLKSIYRILDANAKSVYGSTTFNGKFLEAINIDETTNEIIPSGKYLGTQNTGNITFHPINIS
jgi:hypothetical protein